MLRVPMQKNSHSDMEGGSVLHILQFPIRSISGNQSVKKGVADSSDFGEIGCTGDWRYARIESYADCPTIMGWSRRVLRRIRGWAPSVPDGPGWGNKISRDPPKGTACAVGSQPVLNLSLGWSTAFPLCLLRAPFYTSRSLFFCLRSHRFPRASIAATDFLGCFRLHLIATLRNSHRSSRFRNIVFDFVQHIPSTSIVIEVNSRNT